MEISRKGIEVIKEFEGYREEAYRCSANKLTIGYGHVIKEEESYLKKKRISKEEAEEILKEDIKEFEGYINKIIEETKIELKQSQFDALVSFVYNTGYLKEAMVERIREKDIQGIGEAMLMYNKANGKELKGLTKRRQKERVLFFS